MDRGLMFGKVFAHEQNMCEDMDQIKKDMDRK
jgi:hypothetical protein